MEKRTNLYAIHLWRLKIEIRKEIREWNMEKSIAFSKHSNRQVLLYTHTLKQSMDNKIEALLDRGEIRDAQRRHSGLCTVH